MKRIFLALALVLALLETGVSEISARPLLSISAEPIQSPCSQDLNINNKYQRKVLVLSIPDDGDSDKYSTDSETDQALVNFLCNMDTPTLNSISVQVFDGSNNGELSWSDLDAYTDLVIPASTSSTTSILDDETILSEDTAIELKNWVAESGGHLHMLGIYEQRDLLGYLTEISESNEIDLAFESNPRATHGIGNIFWSQRNNQNLPTVPGLPYEIEMNLQVPLLKTDFYNSMNQNQILKNDLHYRDSGNQDGASWDLVTAGIAQIGNGQIGLYSTKLFDLLGYSESVGISESKNRWFQVIGASLAGHLSSKISIDVGLEYSSVGTSVVGGENLQSHRAFDSALSVRLGGAHESRTIPCINTLKNPLLVRQDDLGIWVVCGEFHIDDGTTEEGFEARLLRWFSKDSNWIRTTVEFRYRRLPETSLTIGLFNDYGSDQHTVISDTNTGFPWSLNSFDDFNLEGDLLWFNVSTDSNIDAEFGSNVPVVLNLTPEWGTNGYGGLNTSDPESLNGLNGGGDAYVVNRSQTLIENFLDIEGDGSSSMTWYTAVVDFETGCDVYALDLAGDIADEFVIQNLFDPNNEEDPYNYEAFNSEIYLISENLNSPEEDPDHLHLPSTSNSCSSYDEQTSLVIEDLASDTANLVFEQISGATWYEVQYLHPEFQEWVSVSDLTLTENTGSAHLANLTSETLYEVRMRAWNEVEQEDGEFIAKHTDWAIEEFLTPAEPAPSSTIETVYVNTPGQNIFLPQIIYVPQIVYVKEISKNFGNSNTPEVRQHGSSKYISKLVRLLTQLTNM
jgi:hypothetical protein